jgi:hypothetical protein
MLLDWWNVSMFSFEKHPYILRLRQARRKHGFKVVGNFKHLQLEAMARIAGYINRSLGQQNGSRLGSFAPPKCDLSPSLILCLLKTPCRSRRTIRFRLHRVKGVLARILAACK